MTAQKAGRPPFQTKDIEEIYMRIHDNIYEFPPDRRIAPDTKDCITSILMPNPSKRPTLLEFLASPFIDLGIIPPFIPASADHINHCATRERVPEGCSAWHAPIPDDHVFIVSWVDSCDKYGMGYALTDGSVGVHFNDSTTLILLTDKHYFYYIASQRQGTVYVRKNFSDHEHTKGMDFMQTYLHMKHVMFKMSHDVLQSSSPLMAFYSGQGSYSSLPTSPVGNPSIPITASSVAPS
ncbi:hypothetical protein AZE42_09015 [Rhizopogon vesiculosus]|uniref:Polo kinase n=1 Tax=Rhizopogon vesiculosus TaxID=180088 RepID=A0A1J8Q4M3_9AGAM|nr:hypothetical protein AZE42_09015 [Rhizopogon vesiculosus]